MMNSGKRSNQQNVDNLELFTEKVITFQPVYDPVFDGIRKTINLFREQPFLYFTELDIHASLSKDILDG